MRGNKLLVLTPVKEKIKRVEFTPVRFTEVVANSEKG
jgi:hypothetical protein